MTTVHTDRYPIPARTGWDRAGVPALSFEAIRRAAAMAVVLFSLSACWGLSGESRSPGSEQLLQSNLSVASAALAAGQPAVAQKIYLALAERFDDAPEPVLGLGYIALQTESPGEAGDYFRRAATLAVDAPDMKAEALLGAARASLAQGDSATARRHLAAARDLAEESSTIAWIENGLAVAAVFEEDYRTAETHYASALRQPSAHPRIAANFIRMLIASERIDEAERTYGAYAESYWEEGDRQALQSLIDEARSSPPPPDRFDPRLLLRLTGTEALPVLADDAAYSVEDSLRNSLEGPVLTIGDRRFPATPVTTATGPAAAAPVDPLLSEPPPEETNDPVPTSGGNVLRELLSVRDNRSTRAATPTLAAAPVHEAASSSVTRSVSSGRSGVLVLRNDPANVSLEGTPGVGAPGEGSRLAEAADDLRLLRHAETVAVPVENVLLDNGELRSGLALVAAPSYSQVSLGPAAPASAAATGSPGVPLQIDESGVTEAANATSTTARVEERTHQFGSDPVQLANALSLAVSPRDVPSLSDDASSRTLSSSNSVSRESETASATPAGAMPEGAPDIAAAEASSLQSTMIDGADGMHQSEPGPTLVVNVAILNDYSNYDPYSAAPAPYRPILLASAAPPSNYPVWDSVWMPEGSAPGVHALTAAAAERQDDWLPQVAETVPPEPATSDEWTVLLGTGQRLTLGVDAAAVAIASPDIADVQLLTPRVLFVMGRNMGRTTVSVLGEDGSVFERDVSVVLDLEPLRALLAGEPGLQGVQVESLTRGVALAGDVDSQDAAERALGLVVASLPEGTLIENNLDVGLDLEPLRALLAGEPGLTGVEIRRVGRSVALTGDVASAEAAERAQGLAVASLPEAVLVENNLRVAFDIEPLTAILAAEPGLEGIQVQRLLRGVALSGNVGSQEEADRALRLATASLSEGTLIENSLEVGLNLGPLRALLAGESGLTDVEVQRIGRGVALTGEVVSTEAANRAHRLAVASLPETVPVENNLRVKFDIVPLRVLLAGEAGLERVQVQRLARGVAVSGYVDSPTAAERALGLASASLPEGLLIEDNLTVGLGLEPLRVLLAGEPGLDDLSPLRAFIVGEPGLEGVKVQRVGRGVALTGEVASAEDAERARRLVVAALPESVPVENNLRVEFDIVPLRVLLAGEAGMDRVHVQRLARGVILAGYVGSPAAEDRALRLAAASLPEGLLIENNLDVGLDLDPLRALLASEPGQEGVQVRRVGRGVALTGEVASADAADRAHRLAVASLPESLLVENNLRVKFDVEPLRAVLAAEPALEGIQLRQLARGVALAGDVASPEAADRAYRLAVASLPEGLIVENNLEVGLDLETLRALMSGETGLGGVEVKRIGRAVALTGEVASADAAERAHRLAVASIPESLLVENNLRVQFDIEPLRTVLAAEPGLEEIRAQRLARGVALAGEVAAPEAADRAHRLAVASLPEGLLVENNLSVVLDLAPLHTLLSGEPGLEGVEVQRIGQGVALTGEVSSTEASDRAHRLVVASLPESLPVENNLRVVFDVGPLRALLSGESELDRIRVQELGRGVVLTGEVASAEASERAHRIATSSLPEGVPVENSLRVVPDIEHLSAALAGEPGLDSVKVQRLARGVALSGDVDSHVAEDRALRLAAASLPEGIPVENNLNVGLDLAPLRSLVAGEPGLKGIRVQGTGRGVALIGEVGSAEAAEQASRLAAALLPEDMPVENNLRVAWDVRPLRALLAGSPELERVQVQRLARGVVLSGDVDSQTVADLALRLAAVSVPEGVLVENNLNVRLDLAPLRVLIAGEPDLRNVRVKRIGRGVALSGEVGSAEASDRAHRLAVASLPEGIAIENGLRVAPDVEPLRALLAGEPGLERVHVQKLARGVALAGDVASPRAADLALRLAAASLPEGMLVENNLNVGLDLSPLQALMVAEEGFDGIRLNRIDRGVALTGEVASQTVAERASRLAAASLPEDALVENNLRVVLDSGPLRAALADDPEFDHVHVRDLEHGVSLNGEVSSAAAADRARRLAAVSLPADTPVENNLRIAGPLQVNLEVQIAEVQRSIAEDFGFNWEVFGRSRDPLGFGFRIGRPPGPGVGRVLPEPLLPDGYPLYPPGSIPTTIVDGLTSPTFIAQRAWDNIGITGMVDALAKAGLANVLARPNVTANSGETASFFSGGEFPLPSGYKDGVIVFEYKKYGVLLDFVPTIVDDGRVELTVRPEVSEPSRDNSVQVEAGINVPVINVRRAETTVEMGDGESIVIAGLFRSASDEVQSGVPVLKDLPLLGAMFGHTSTRADELELIVTVTARLVQAGPVSGEAITAGSGQANNSYYY